MESIFFDGHNRFLTSSVRRINNHIRLGRIRAEHRMHAYAHIIPRDDVIEPYL
jgi:hypothetical protein